MRKLTFIKSLSLTGGQTVSIEVPVGRYAGLFFTLSGTTDTAQTLALADIGSVRIQRGGRQIQGNTVAHFHNLADLLGGFPATVAGSAATAESVSWPIMFSMYGVPNAMEVASRNELVIFVDPSSTLATRFGSNTITLDVHGIVDDLTPETYELQTFTQDFTRSAAGEESETLTKDNIAMVAINDSSAVINAIQLSVDGQEIIERVNDSILTAYNNLIYRVESAGITLTLLPTATGPIAAAYLNENAELRMNFTGSGTVLVTAFSIQPAPGNRASVSANAVQAIRRNAEAKLRAKILGAGR